MSQTKRIIGSRKLWKAQITHWNTDRFELLEICVHARDRRTARIKAIRDNGLEEHLILTIRLTPLT